MRNVTLALFSAIILGATSFFSVAQAADGSVQASKYVESLGNRAIAIIANEKLPKVQKQKQLEKIFAENVDIPWVGRFVMGRFWRTATPEQQKRYLKEYETFVITHYASRFAEYSGGKFTITSTRKDSENEFTVSMKMETGDQGAEPVAVDYRVRSNAGSMKVFDVIVEGVSMITTQRAEFNAILNDKGIDTLIDKLASKSLSAEVAAKK
ncbi:MAG: ABC transporter substrate-binding protein [Alphaproteobacteria bacterium]|nr:ABC transporter substrate-binding protein [Alphaproteobacteria bacterium]